MLPVFFLVLRVRRHAHEALDLQAFQGQKLFQHCVHRARIEAELGALSGDIHLQVNLREEPQLCCDAVDVSGDVDIVHAVDGLHDGQHFADLVGLKMSDEVPLNG